MDFSDLTEEQRETLEKQDSRKCEPFRAEKFQKESKRHWDLFYKRNETRFFKDRHWTTREFQELVGCENRQRVILEVGSGVGNFVFPLLEEFPSSASTFFYACDLSPRAIEFVKDNPNYNEERVKAFQCDVTHEGCFSDHVKENEVDIASMIFLLSSIRPSNFLRVLSNVRSVLKPGGLLIFRDYAVNDMAMFRFKPGSKIGERHYVRQDGTTSYFFTPEELASLLEECGFKVEVNEIIERKTINIKEGLDVPRLFLQGKYRRI